MSKKHKYKQKNSFGNNSISSLGSHGGMIGYGNSNINQIDTLRRYVRKDTLTFDYITLGLLYMQEGLIRRIIQTMVDDALQNGIKIICDDDNNKKKIENALIDTNFLDALKTAFYYARLYGGAGLLICTSSSFDIPMNQTKNDLEYLYFEPITRWDIHNVSTGNIHELKGQAYIEVRNQKVHRSKLIFIDGEMPPTELLPYYGGWGSSIVDTVASAITPYIKIFTDMMEIIDESKVDVYKLKQFGSLTSPKVKNIVEKRIQDVNSLKSFFNAVILDANDEFEQKVLGTSGIDPFFPEIRMRISMATKIPMSRLFGDINKGFSTGEDDLEIYNATVESSVRQRMYPIIHQVLPLLCDHALDNKDSDVRFEFNPLRVLNPEKEEAIRASKTNRLSQIKASGALSNKDYIEELKAEDLLNTNVEAIDEEEMTDQEDFNKSFATLYNAKGN